MIRRIGSACDRSPPWSDLPENCNTEGLAYCFSHLSQRATNIAAATPTTITITPSNFEKFVPRWFLVTALITATSTRVINGQVVSCNIKGDDQFGGTPVEFDAFGREVTVLEVNWRHATPQNPIVFVVQHFDGGGNADIALTVAGDGRK